MFTDRIIENYTYQIKKIIGKIVRVKCFEIIMNNNTKLSFEFKMYFGFY